ncbi:hypothetical protein ABPG72_017217 [Tetrahymena utriculariae]
MIVVNKQANSNVTQTTVRNFYPKNPPKSAASHSTMTYSNDNLYKNQHAYSPHNQLSQSITPNAKNIKIEEYSSVYETPKQSINQSQSQKVFHNTAQSFFKPQKNELRISESQHQLTISQNFNNTSSKKQTEEGDKEKLLDAKKVRQQTEMNVNLLKNRIHLLELKEKETVNKMIQTQKKTIDIIMNKTSHQQKIQNKQESLLKQQEDLIRKQMEVKIMREQKKTKDEILKQKRVQSAQLQAKRIKDLKSLYSTHLQYMQEEMQLRNAQSYETVKLQEKEQEVKRKQLEDSKKNLAHQLYKNRCKQEISKKAQNEMYYLELERKEQELLKKLEASQNLQYLAFTELRKALSPQHGQSISNNSSTNFKQSTHNYYIE